MSTEKTGPADRKFIDEARALPKTAINVPLPIHVLLGEATDVASFAEKYWAATREPRTKRVLRPGLESVVGAKKQRTLTAKTRDEIRELRAALQHAQSDYVLTTSPRAGTDPFERGEYLVGELSAALEYLFDDGVEDANDQALANVAAAHRDEPASQDSLASELEDYAALASRHRDALDGVGGFQVEHIDEAHAVATQLREKPADAGAARTRESTDALDLRNRLATLLLAKMTDVRSAARFVFRHHPEIVREATSAYERRKRAASRRSKAKTPPAAPAGGPTT